MKRIISSIRIILAVTVVIAIILSLMSCAEKESAGQAPSSPEPGASDQNRADDIWFCNRFSSVGEPPFSLPDGKPAQGSDGYSYTGVSSGDYSSFLADLRADGFSHVHMKYSDFLLRGDCMIFSRYTEGSGSLTVSWYQKSPYAPVDGISADEAKAVLIPDSSLSKTPLLPIDVTPEGFYERTGGQLFAVPYYSYDNFSSSGSEDLIFEDNEWYACKVCYVNGDEVFAVTMERVAVCDIDGDGGSDVLLLSFGPTSGLFTFEVNCITNHGTYFGCFNTDHFALGFGSKDGKLVIEGDGSLGVHHCYEVRLAERNGQTIVMLYENGEEPETWGM